VSLSSKTLTEHLVRGSIGICSLWWAIQISGRHPALALALGMVAIIAFRGCPICWTMGLFGTLGNLFKRKPHHDPAARP
jgi:hypothetical protein